MKIALLALLLLGGAVAVWLVQTKADPPAVPFAKATRETLISTLPTNGKVEPAEWRPVRAEAGGILDQVTVKEGDSVHSGALIASLRLSQEQSALASAEARVARARADLAVIEGGGRAAELTEVDNALSSSRFQKETAEKELAALRRLLGKAATQIEVDGAERKLRQIEIDIESLRKKRVAIAAPALERAATEARLKEAQAEVDAARRKIAQAEMRASISGVVYNLAARPGAFVNPGDSIANIGRLDRLRVRVYVDEPEVGRVALGQPVKITWDALAGASWEGKVERLPSEIRPLNTRQVGEVLCTIENRDGRLVPGVNINAEIRTAIVTNALTIPKEAVQRRGAEPGVFVAQENRIGWRKIVTGASSATRIEIKSGLADADSVALPGERPLKDGDQITPLQP